MKKKKKSYAKAVNLKYKLPHRMVKLKYLMDHFLYQVFKIILTISSKNETLADIFSIVIIVHKFQN